MQKHLVMLSTVSLVLVSHPALAQEEELIGLDVSAALDVRHVENADLQPDSADQVNELQYFTTLAADGHLKGSWAEFTTDYRWEDRRHAKLDEQDERVLIGSADLILGPQHRRYYAQITHSSEEVGVDPSERDVASNRDNRMFLSAALVGSLQPGRANLLTFWVGATDIQFDQNEENEASRYSGGVSFEHAISPLYDVGVALSGYELKYRYVDDRDLTYSRAALVWSARLRQLDYSFELGANAIETQGETLDSPSAKVDVEYRTGVQSWLFSYNQFLSDTSQGSSEAVEIDPAVNVDGRLEGEIDQFKSRLMRLGWSHSAVCGGCSLSITLGYDEEDYVNFDELSSREMLSTIYFSYLATPQLLLSLSSTYSDFDEINDPEESGYTQIAAEFTLAFPQIIRGGELALYVGGVDRSQESLGDYTSEYIGARFQYLLYSR